ncbi:hypothetical protein Tco_0570834, partial [Tanacetum coccineum]
MIYHFPIIYKGQWVKGKKDNATSLRKELKTKLAAIDTLIDKGVSSSAHLEDCSDIMNHLSSLDNTESIELAQKAKGPIAVKNEFLSHFQSRFEAPCANRLVLDMVFPNRLSPEQAQDLERVFVKEEIKEAVWDCGLDKSPGPDGGNLSFIALIPKFQGAKMVKDYRPISFIGSLYKIITKLLANRLVTVIDGLVNEVQSAFIANRVNMGDPFNSLFLLSLVMGKTAFVVHTKNDVNSRASGMRINLHKSKIMGIAVDNSLVTQAANSIGCLTLSLPFQYLGVNIGRAPCPRTKSWDFVPSITFKVASPNGRQRLGVGSLSRRRRVFLSPRLGSSDDDKTLGTRGVLKRIGVRLIVSRWCMTRSSTEELLSPFENSKQKFCSRRRLFDTPSLVESNSPEFDHIFYIEEQSGEEVRETMTETMKQYMSKTRGDYGGSEHEDENEHIEKEVILFYNGLDVPTGQILDSKGAITSKTAADAKIAIQVMAEYSQKWHNVTSLRTRSTKTFDKLAAIQAQLNNLRREIKKVNEKVYATQFGAPYQPGGQYKAAGPGFYQRNNGNSSYPDRRPRGEESLTKFM